MLLLIGCASAASNKVASNQSDGGPGAGGTAGTGGAAGANEGGPLPCGECVPNTTDYRCCDQKTFPYSSQSRTCSSACAWGSYGACQPENLGDPTSPSPADGASGVSRTPTFKWSLPQPGSHGFYTNLYLWTCAQKTTSCLVGTASIGNPSTPVTSIPFSAMVVPNTKTPLPQLGCNTSYWWLVTPGTTCGNTHITTVTWSFTTGCN